MAFGLQVVALGTYSVIVAAFAFIFLGWEAPVAAGKRKTRNKKTAVKQKNKWEEMGLKKTGMSVSELRRALKKGQEYAELEQWEKALPELMKAWEAMPDDVSILTLLSHSLAQLGVRDKAVLILERTLELHGATPEIIGVMLNLSLELAMHEVAAKLCRVLIEADPNNPNNYVNLATAYTGMNMLDESIDMLQSIIPMFPENSNLWNVLATQVRSRDGVDAASVFFEEALRLAPNDFKILSNYGHSLLMKGDWDKALELDLRSIKANPNSPEPRLGAAQLLFYNGRFDEAWPHYEHRLSTRRRVSQTQIYTHGIDSWEGQPLEGKALLVTAEQGIGDEILFGNHLPYVYDRAKKLVIGCDYRLVDIYKRRFPNAHVERYIDRMVSGYRYRNFPMAQHLNEEGEMPIDYAIPVCSLPKFDWSKTSDLKPHPQGFLWSDPEQVKDIKARFAAMGDKPKVALAWRSGLINAERSYIYGNVEGMAPLKELSKKVDFINIQYGDTTDELARAKEMHDITIHALEGIDLKMDIDANLAIMEACDLVISSCSAPGQFSLAVGAPTILAAASKQWWAFGGGSKVPFAVDGELILGGEIVDWDDIWTRISNNAMKRLGL